MKMKFPTFAHSSRRRAFSLVEVVFALGVSTFCITTLVAMLPVGLRSNSGSSARVTALNLCTALETELRASARQPGQVSQLIESLGLEVPAAGQPERLVEFYDVPGAFGFQSKAAPQSRFRFQVRLTPPALSPQAQPAIARVQATWPAPAQPREASGSVKTVVVLDNSLP